MDEKPERPAAGEPDLAAALRRARVENAERAEAVAELREIELGRLALLESALQRVVRQAPAGVDLFDLTLARGDRPRVFLDMIAFIEMARDRRTYRFFQDTLYGRVLIAESPKIDTIVAACTNYVARRLVERERALAAEAPPGQDMRVDSTAPPLCGRATRRPERARPRTVVTRRMAAIRKRRSMRPSAASHVPKLSGPANACRGRFRATRRRAVGRASSSGRSAYCS